MNQPIGNDQAYIAGSFSLDDDYVARMSKLASFKIHSYKLSLVNAAFCATKDELGNVIRGTLMNFTDAGSILVDTGFFNEEIDN